jgi:hypothetical protein
MKNFLEEIRHPMWNAQTTQQLEAGGARLSNN